MPAGLTKNDGMMYLKAEGKPWHGLGVALDAPATAAEAIKAASLDWTVETRPVVTYRVGEWDALSRTERRTEMLIPNKKAIVRTDTQEVFAIMGDGYEPVQNVDAFNFFDAVIAQGEAMYHTAGSLFGGKKVWIMAKLPQDIVVSDNDKIEQYILLSTSHDGSTALRMQFTPVRVVCNNTLSFALRDATGAFYAKHTRNVMERASEARHVLGLAEAYYEMFARQVDELVNTRMTVIEVQDYLQKLYNFKEDVKYGEQDYRILKQYEETLDLLNHSTNMTGGMQGTKWAAYNAVTYYIDHERAVQGQEYQSDKRLNNSWFGRGVDLRQRAYDLLV
jgi:phage/plasmid-like protein (TIGR03299 family)